MGKFIQKIDNNYHEWVELSEHACTKLEYLGNVIFDFTTYSSDIDIIFAQKMVPVLKCILNRKTFEYIKDNDHHINYISMCNSPFLIDKLEWGTSIRGAWFNDAKSYRIDCGRIIIKEGELKEFIEDIIEWLEK